MRSANGNRNRRRMQALDLLQTSFFHQPVVRGLQVKQWHIYLTSFPRRIAVQSRLCALRQDRGGNGTRGALDSEYQAIGSVHAGDEIFKCKLRWIELKKERASQDPRNESPVLHRVGDEANAKNNPCQIVWMPRRELYGKRRSVGLT